MFGYVRPYKPEQKVKEYELFRAAYCGLCWALKEKYGGAARYIINYDFTFLAMLLSEKDCSPEVCSGRCPASPCRKKNYLRSGAAFEAAADYSIILMYWKLKDAAQDGGLKEKALSLLASLALSRAYKKASAARPDFAETTRSMISGLSELERSCCSSLDEAADKFARILEAAADAMEPESERRITAQILYQLGRSVYILDALDDYPDDAKSGNYNPLIYRFETGGNALGEAEKNCIEETLRHSQGLMSSAYELKDKNVYAPVIANTIYLGLDNVREKVLAGKGAELKYTNNIHKSRS